MSSSGIKTKAAPLELSPHQAVFVETVFNPVSKRVILLRANAGLGKSSALIAVARQLLLDRPTARILFLTPNLAMQSWLVDRLRNIGISSLGVDRYRYREMLDATIGEGVWPQGVITVMSRNFAKHSDILESLAATNWDLVIADEAHGFTGADAEALREIGASAARILLAFAFLPEHHLFNVFPAEDTTVVEWPLSLVFAHGEEPRPILNEVPFTLNEAELNLRATVGELFELLGSGTGAQALNTVTLLSSLESSPTALEGVLQRIIQGSEEHVITDAPMDNMDNELINGREMGIDRDFAEKVNSIAVHALEDIEAISSDSKLSAFSALMTGLSTGGITDKSVCIITNYESTLYYLAAEIEDRDMTYHLLHSRIPADDRDRVLTQLSNVRGVLMTTLAPLQGVELNGFSDLILYDIPASKEELWVVLSRFVGSGLSSHLNIHVLAPPVGVDGLTDKGIARIRHELSRDANSLQSNG